MSETNFQDSFGIQIDFSRTLKFALTRFTPKISIPVNSPYCLPYISFNYLKKFTRFPKLSTFHHGYKACPKGKSTNWLSMHRGITCTCTLNEISVQSVMPCVIIGSWSSVLPSQQSSSIQRQPASNACLYISTEDFPVN